jgi:predicted NUDIX family phosphoesterase
MAAVALATEEAVLCVPRCILNGRADVTTDGLRALLRTFRATSEYRWRSQAEDDPTVLQIIPYVLVHDPVGDSFYATRRLPRGTERRLHGRWALGVGGHINPVDGRGEDPIVGGLAREWAEELSCPRPASASLCGVIVDQGSPVSQVHLGLVFWVDVTAQGLRVRETDKLAGEWLARNELPGLRSQMEPWGRLVLDHLTALETEARMLPAMRVTLAATAGLGARQLA